MVFGRRQEEFLEYALDHFHNRCKDAIGTSIVGVSDALGNVFQGGTYGSGSGNDTTRSDGGIRGLVGEHSR